MPHTAIAHPNIALIKYWGNRDPNINLPSNGSISITLDGLSTVTTTEFDPGYERDVLEFDGRVTGGAALERVSRHLDLVRDLSGTRDRARVSTTNDFPPDAGIASSASAFAALTVSAAAAAGLALDAKGLSLLARRGSGSAARSICAGYVELLTGAEDSQSFAQQIASPEHWTLVDLVVVVDAEPKSVSSYDGHLRAETSPLQAGRVREAPERLAVCRESIADRDFSRLAEVVERDSDLMHAVMASSNPPLHYTTAQTEIIKAAVGQLREAGVEVMYTIDAGPNVHCICTPQFEQAVQEALGTLLPDLRLLRGVPGGPARLV